MAPTGLTALGTHEGFIPLVAWKTWTSPGTLEKGEGIRLGSRKAAGALMGLWKHSGTPRVREGIGGRGWEQGRGRSVLSALSNPSDIHATCILWFMRHVKIQR